MNSTEKKPFDPIMYIVVRGDLEIPSGKLAAQAGHAAVGAFLDADFKAGFADTVGKWLNNGQAKICVRVADAHALHALHHEMIDKAIPCELIEDAGHTVFDKPTVTCLGIGPLWRSEAGDLAKLPLY